MREIIEELSYREAVARLGGEARIDRAIALPGHFSGQRWAEIDAAMRAAGSGTPEPLNQHAPNCRQRGLRRWPW